MLAGLWNLKDSQNTRQNRSKNKLVRENAVTRAQRSCSLLTAVTILFTIPDKQISSLNSCHYQTVTFFCSKLLFSTKDVDNDLYVHVNCPVLLKGAWWYHSCSQANLNGLYRRGTYKTYPSDGVKWVTFRGSYYSLKRTEMKLKRKP